VAISAATQNSSDWLLAIAVHPTTAPMAIAAAHLEMGRGGNSRRIRDHDGCRTRAAGLTIIVGRARRARRDRRDRCRLSFAESGSSASVMMNSSTNIGCIVSLPGRRLRVVRAPLLLSPGITSSVTANRPEMMYSRLMYLDNLVDGADRTTVQKSACQRTAVYQAVARLLP
jgi:hypothetical protein